MADLSTIDALDPRIYVTLDHLNRLGRKSAGLSFLPRQPAGSVLNGRRASRMRGRGLNFEEIRGYLPGDDVRSIDWKVTARTGDPHVRVYSEERDRPALILVDQRMSMFFGSRLNMKSVTAAEAAAIAAWRIVGVGDRVGGIVFTDETMVSFRPQRSRKAVNAILKSVADCNVALRADRSLPDTPMVLNRPLEAAARIARHDHLVVILSDFDGIDDGTQDLIRNMARHNDVVLVLVHDPMAQDIPATDRLVVSDGRLQVTLDPGSSESMAAVGRFARDRLQRIFDWQSELGVAVLPLSAGEDTLSQVQHFLGARRGTGRS